MTINHYPHESLSSTETSPDLHSQLDLEDRSQFIQDKEDIATESLDDRTIVKRFAFDILHSGAFVRTDAPNFTPLSIQPFAGRRCRIWQNDERLYDHRSECDRH